MYLVPTIRIYTNDRCEEGCSKWRFKFKFKFKSQVLFIVDVCS